MGKSQKKRAVRRHNPVRVPDAHLPNGLDAAAASSTKRDAVLPIIQKLEGIDPGERAWACSAVSNLIQNDPSTRRLLQGKNVVGALINRLSDSVEEVVIEAAGALRNLCIDGGYDICAEMYNKNILAPLTQCLPKISTALEQFISSPKSAPDSAKDLVFGFTENVITILWCLSETSNKALNAVNKIQLVPFLLAILDHRPKLAPRTVNAAAQCLYVLTDDNFPIINEVRSSASCVSTLMQIVTSNQQTHAESQSQQGPTLSLRISAAGILKNISPIPPPSNASSVDINAEVVLPLLTPVIQSVALPDISAQVLNLITRQSEEPIIDKPSLKHTPKSDHKSEIQLELEHTEESLRTVQLSLEILTDVCATLPDPDLQSGHEGENVDGAADNDDTDEDASGDENDNVDMNQDESVVNGNVELSSKLTSTALPALTESLLRLSLPTELSFPPLSTSTAAPSPYPPITSALGSIHIRALECLNNLFLSLAVALSSSRNSPNASTAVSVAADVASGNHVWESLWSTLSKVGLEGVIGIRGQEIRNQVWEATVGVLWSVSDIWKGHIVPQAEQVQVLMQLYGNVPDDHFKVKCIGTLECMAQHPQSVEANALIATFLLSILPGTASSNGTHSTECTLQATSALIDIYSDENMPYDVNFRTGPHLQILSDGIEGLRRLVRGIDRKKDGGKELRRRGDEILENLRSFVKYRRNLKL